MTKVPAAQRTRKPSPVKTGLRVFGNKPFMRFARKFGVSDQDLWDAAQREPDADLGGSVFKFRLAREGEGTSGGARSIVAIERRTTDRDDVWIREEEPLQHRCQRSQGVQETRKDLLGTIRDGDRLARRNGELTEIEVSPTKKASETK